MKIDDMSYIAEMEHTKCGAWERYDFEIAPVDMDGMI